MMSIINKIKDKISSGSFGFEMEELMSGHHEFEPGMGPEGKQPFEFCVKWGAADLSEWSSPKSDSFMTNFLEGTVTVGGLCYNAPCRGTLHLMYFSEYKIRYTFEFEANGKSYTFIGEKVNIKPWNLPVSHTTCYGTLTETETKKLVSRSLTFFKLRTAPSFISSFRII